MASKSVLDNYDQFASLTCIGGVGASGQLFTQLQTGITTLQKVAWAVSRIEYSIPLSWYSKLAAAAEYVRLELTSSGVAWSGLPATKASIYDHILIALEKTPAALNSYDVAVLPIVHSFPEASRLLVLPQMLYASVTWGVAAGLTADPASLRVYYRELELGPEDWYDLLQMRMPLGAVY